MQQGKRYWAPASEQINIHYRLEVGLGVLKSTDTRYVADMFVTQYTLQKY